MRANGTPDLAELGLAELAVAPGIEWSFLADAPAIAGPTQLAELDGIVLEMMDIRASSLDGVERLALVARYGVGFDAVDVEACTGQGIIVTNTPDGTQRPMATVNLAFLLALSLRLPEKDRMTREGRWQEGSLRLGMGLRGRTLGMVGMGSIGAETLRLVAPLEMRRLVFDPYVADDTVRATDAEPVSLDVLLRESDFVCLSLPLTPQTRRLIGEREIDLMKPTAFLINASRGAVVDETVLIAALESRRIQGAALDVFEQEPIDRSNPLLRLDNVILAPHSLGSTDECFSLIGQSVTRSILDVAAGRVPRFVVNRAVLDNPRTRARLAAFAEARPQGDVRPGVKED
jgi:D-3-phosphoglycerate dehydrogenase